MGSDFLAYYDHGSHLNSDQLTKGDSNGETPSDTEDDEIDLAKTKESLWSLFTGGFQTMNQYESVFEFIEESMPQLKRVQQ